MTFADCPLCAQHRSERAGPPIPLPTPPPPAPDPPYPPAADDAWELDPTTAELFAGVS